MTPEFLTRLKVRFFNLAKPDEDDPEGINPISSPPFFENKHEQFCNELLNSSFKLYHGIFLEEENEEKEEQGEQKQEEEHKEFYLHRNFNKLFCSRIEDEYSHYFFVVFRCIITEKGIIYESYWISNHVLHPSTIFDNFDWKEEENKLEFCEKFKRSDLHCIESKQDYETFLTNNDYFSKILIDEVYAR